jgi:capsular polysaccharide biosynthesis protein
MAEDPIELQKHWDAIRTTFPRVVRFAVALALGTFIVSLLLPRWYAASATLFVENATEIGTEEDVLRTLATLQALATTEPVLDRAAKAAPALTTDELRDRISAKPSDTANILRITARSRSAREAAAMANGVARGFPAQLHADAVAQAREDVRALIEEIRRGGDPADPTLRRRLSRVMVSRASAPATLRLVEAARPPPKPSFPKPFQNGLIASS